ncbi:MAG: hypothetical protein LBD71_03650 [Treponema sp.]|jgi:hypothetical protein|nr:hypothetical protein [Treponema sp.]
MSDETASFKGEYSDITTRAGIDAGGIATLAGPKSGAPPSSAAVIPGSRLLDLYDVAPGKPAGGGFGRVYKVRGTTACIALDDFNSILIPDLQNRGYGWLRPEGIRKEPEEMAKER